MDRLSADLIDVPGLEVRIVERCTSTNSALLAEKSRGRILLAAEEQTAGRAQPRHRRHCALAPGGARALRSRRLRRRACRMGGDGRARRTAPSPEARERAFDLGHRRRARRRRGAAPSDPQRREIGAQRPDRFCEAGVILAIDAGNSRVKWGWHDGQRWTSVATVSLIEFAASSDHVNPFSVTHADPEHIVISNVAGEGAHHLLVNWTSIFEAEPLWLRAEAE